MNQRAIFGGGVVPVKLKDAGPKELSISALFPTNGECGGKPRFGWRESESLREQQGIWPRLRLK